MAKCRHDQQSGAPCPPGAPLGFARSEAPAARGGLARGLLLLEVVDIDPPGHQKAEGPQEEVSHHCGHVDVFWPVHLNAKEGHEDERNGEDQIDPYLSADLARLARLDHALLAGQLSSHLAWLFVIQASGVLRPLKAGRI